jgi:hypothetical protein
MPQGSDRIQIARDSPAQGEAYAGRKMRLSNALCISVMRACCAPFLAIYKSVAADAQVAKCRMPLQRRNDAGSVLPCPATSIARHRPGEF